MSADDTDEAITVSLPVTLPVKLIHEIAKATERGKMISLEPPSNLFDEAASLSRARWLLQLMDVRKKVSCGDLFSDPAWAILLDLYVREGDGKQTSVSSACIGAKAPMTTALRYIAVLEDRGAITRSPDLNDARKVYLHLSNGAREEISNLLFQMP